MVQSIWVAVLYISEATAAKLSTVHGLDADEVRLALVAVRGLTFTWNEHPERGRRAIVEVFIRKRRVLVVLYLREDPFGDSWELGSAYPLDK